jgi:fructose-1,6-bisphosphatase/inositol monophosphatase family enzyme
MWIAQAGAALFAVIISEPSQMKRAEVAIEAAKIAGGVVRRGDGAELDIQEKDSSRTSIVTAVDLRSQQEVIRAIRRSFPHD